MQYLRTFAQIDLNAIEHNFDALSACAGDGRKRCAVIKANGYGHGALKLAETLTGKADFFAVATADEALELRRGGIKTPILILSYTHRDDHEALVGADVSLTVYRLSDARELDDTAARLGKRAKLHIALDTGMTRIGFPYTETALDEIAAIARLPHCVIEGVFSHFACADCADKTVAQEQRRVYDAFLAGLDARNVDPGIRHLCNSAAISEFGGSYDMVRMGISLYGLYPSDEVDKAKVDLIPAMTFKSHIILVKDVPAGRGISYGHIYHTPETRRIATVCAGYADGYPRALSNRGRVLIRGKSAPIVGRVCMDQFMVDVTDIPDAAIDDEVVLWGPCGGDCIPAEEIGAMSESFNYEVVCGVAKRDPRVYVKDGAVVAVVNDLR